MIIETKIVIHDDYCKNTSTEDVAKILSQITDLLSSVDRRTFAEKPTRPTMKLKEVIRWNDT